jgi:hypothetical protein
MYYPKNKIITNLYTNGGLLYYLESQLPYIGYYYKLYNGKYFSGKSPNSAEQELVLNTSSTNPNSPIYTLEPTLPNNQAVILSTNVIQKVPTFYYPQPSENDYQIGSITRFFVKKTNENKFLEVNAIDYNAIFYRNNEYVYQLYTAFSMPWTISGNKQKVIQTNKDITINTQLNLKLFGLTLFLEQIGGYDKFYK